MLQKLQGYRTLISLAVSFILKILVLKGFVTADKDTAATVNLATDATLLGISLVADLAAAYFKLKSPVPGPLSAEGKAQREWVKTGVDRRNTTPGGDA